MRVLVVDDYPGAAEICCMLLRFLKHDCTAAYTGQEAIDTVASFKPQVLILDIGLPDLSGYEIARELRGRPDGRKLFIAALTGWGAPEDRVRSIAAGIDMHVLKPASAIKLSEIVAAATARFASAGYAVDRA